MRLTALWLSGASPSELLGLSLFHSGHRSWGDTLPRFKNHLFAPFLLSLLLTPACMMFAQNVPASMARNSAAKSVSLDHSIFGNSMGTEKSLPFVSTIFGDNMVLQRGKPDAIWGWAKPGDTVQVQIAARRATGLAAADGRWQVKIAPPPTGGPYTMKITDGHQSVAFQNVMAGDVWICGGQSNMELPLRFTDNAAKVAAQANYPNIRYFTVGDHTAYRPTYTLKGSWKAVTPQTAGWLSAVGFYFGLKLEQKLHI